MGKLGFTTSESSQLIKELEQGNATAVWSQISSKIQGLSEDTTLTIDPAEGQALAQALGLSTDAQNRLTSFFAKFADTELTATDIRSALLAITAEVADNKSAQSQALDEGKELAPGVHRRPEAAVRQTCPNPAMTMGRERPCWPRKWRETSRRAKTPRPRPPARSVADLAFASKDAASADQPRASAKSATAGQDTRSEADSQGRSQGTSQDIAQGASQDASQDASRDVSQEASQEGSQGRGKSAAGDRMSGGKVGTGQEKAAAGNTEVLGPDRQEPREGCLGCLLGPDRSGRHGRGDGRHVRRHPGQDGFDVAVE
jgi:hypothetical protein